MIHVYYTINIFKSIHDILFYLMMYRASMYSKHPFYILEIIHKNIIQNIVWTLDFSKYGGDLIYNYYVQF